MASPTYADRQVYLQQLAAIHELKRDLALTDDTYRATLESITGKRSSRDMNDLERERVIGYLTAMSDHQQDFESVTVYVIRTRQSN
jgi:phage gp16-like protein